MLLFCRMQPPYDTKKSRRILKHVFKTLRQSWPKRCCKRVVRRLHATKSYHVNVYKSDKSLASRPFWNFICKALLINSRTNLARMLIRGRGLIFTSGDLN